jgi:hypothetical protein
MEWNGFELKICSTPEDYLQIIMLRHRSYISEGKAHADALPQVFSDSFDTRATLGMMTMGGNVIGSVRVTIHNDADPTWYGRYITDPSILPPQQAYTEASRLCVSPEHQGTKISFPLAASMIHAGIVTGRRYMIGGADDIRVGIWKKCGASEVGLQYTNAQLGNITHHLLIMDLDDVKRGKGVDSRCYAVLEQLLQH